jgi:hypothetical protein
MERLRIRLLSGMPTQSSVPCCRCGATGQPWDRIAGKSYCPNCQETMALGETPPVREAAEAIPCVVCAGRRTVSFLTYPLHSRVPVEMNLCADHLERLLSRRLGPYAFIQIRRQLRALALMPDDIFLLHNEFYDVHGQALRPAVEAE